MKNITSEDIDKFKSEYSVKGTAYIEESSIPFDEQEIINITEYCEKVEKEFVKVGDANEPNHVYVGRFMTDVKKPEIVNNEYSEKMLKILGSEKIKSFIKKVLDTKEKIFLRRVQYNEITENCFVGYHLDIDSNPDYVASCVIQLGKNFDGGLYRVYQNKNKEKYNDFKPNFGSLIISDCRFPHEVTKVTKGKRGSLIFFVSYNKGLNKRNI